MPLQILVADDNRDAADSLAMILQAEGHEVRATYDGQEALNTALATRPDVAILDLGMPRLDGLFVAEAIRRSDPATLLLALTGYGDERNIERCRAAGFSRHFTKPVDVQELLDVVSTHRPPPGRTPRAGS